MSMILMLSGDENDNSSWVRIHTAFIGRLFAPSEPPPYSYVDFGYLEVAEAALFLYLYKSNLPPALRIKFFTLIDRAYSQGKRICYYR